MNGAGYAVVNILVDIIMKIIFRGVRDILKIKRIGRNGRFIVSDFFDF